jgi:hypothetical protein
MPKKIDLHHLLQSKGKWRGRGEERTKKPI